MRNLLQFTPWSALAPVRLLFGLCGLLLAGACGGNAAPSSDDASGAGAPRGEAGSLGLEFSAQPEGSAYRLVLSAPQANDLYQLAGTLVYDPERYSLLRVEAGGGLGSPQTSYLFEREARPGQRGFAYTRRLAGPGASGAVSLIHFIVEPRAGGRFDLADFLLNTAEAPLRVRDSRKHDFGVSITRREVRQ